MPFTFAHPAAILPLKQARYGFSLTALVMGSMVPDFEFILRMQVAENIGHHPIGFFLFDVPVALLLSVLFHHYVRDLLITHLPKWFRVRLAPFAGFNWVSYALNNKMRVFLSCLVGLLTHLFLDGFAHHDGVFVQWFPLLQAKLTLFQHSIPGYMVVQLVSSVIGLWLVYRAVATLPTVPDTTGTPSPLYWWAIINSAATLLLIRWISLPDHQTFWDLFFAGMGSLVYALIGVSMLFKAFEEFSWQEQSQ
ncbi:DUF4184 family protein [Rudanella lutea]|uniref:DUF4184 family protein n=1 Tax=Rudanella lutea TaxID=451374 RepID=UPI00035DED52|nr:DUF4184 family protein [Rudanella lutea]